MSELSFTDGSAPTQEIVEAWLCLVNKEFLSDPTTCIGVHCVTGLGRAPVLVATALIELGMKYEVQRFNQVRMDTLIIFLIIHVSDTQSYTPVYRLITIFKRDFR